MILRFFFWREFKKYPLFFALVLFTLLLGTLGLAGISVISEEVSGKLKARSHELLTSDMAITARRSLSEEEKKIVDDILTPQSVSQYQVIDIYSMISHLRLSQSRLVEIRAIEEGFPFHGQILQREGEFTPEGLKVSKDLENLWSITTGDEIQVGEVKLKVSGIIDEDSSLGLRGFSLAPRIYIPLSELKRSGLLRPGATGSFAYHYRLPSAGEEDLKKLKSAIFKKISDPAIKVVLPEDSSAQTGRVINVLSNFMSLSALIGLILSLVGIFYLYQSHLLARLKDLCLLNLHGLQKSRIVLGILGQFSSLFVIVFFLQLLIILPFYRFIQAPLSKSLGLDLGTEMGLMALVRQLPFLYILTLSILVPLLFGLMRTPMGLMLKAARISLGRFRFYDFIPFLLLLWGFSCYLSNSLKIGNIFFFSLIIVFVISTTIVRLGQWSLKKIIHGKGLLTPNIEWGIALRSLTRSGHKLTLSFLSLALGATLISLILQLDGMIQQEFAMDKQRPGLFIFDIQEEQIDEFLEYAKDQQTPLEAVTPMIRARLDKVNGKKFIRKSSSVKLRENEDDQESRERNTGLNLTSRSYLTGAEKIISGEPFPETSTGVAKVSLERRWADRMELGIGDQVVFDVQGVEVEGVIHNIRDVKWTSFYPNFFVNLEPPHLEDAPKTYLAILPSGFKEKKLDFQRTAVLRFPNISFIDVEDLVGKLALLFERARQAIEIISMLSLGVGLVILYGLSHDQVYRRYYDLALMKTLGLSSDRLRLNLLIEFGLLFGSALGLGLFLGWLMAQLIGQEVFKLPFGVDWGRIILPAIALSVLCLVTILISSWRTIRAQPRELLGDA